RRPAWLERHAPTEDGAAARLLARARPARLSRDTALTPRELPEEAWLRARFELDEGATVAASVAPPGDSTVLVVRPVHLHVGLDHLVLAVPQAGDIAIDEARALADSANALFAADGLAW